MSSESQSTNAAVKWAQKIFGDGAQSATLLHGDASRRLYFRIENHEQSHIIVNASAELTEVPAFVAIDKSLATHDIRVPAIHELELSHGYLLLEDFGEQLLLPLLTEKNVEQWYQQAFAILLKMQSIKQVENYHLINFANNAYTREFKIFTDWYLDKYCQANYKPQMLEAILASLIDNNLQQPQVFVHRDFHSRNLMVLEDEQLGLLDFQGAKWGPITYDLVSLLKDCYIDWPAERIEKWLQEMHTKLCKQQNIKDVSFSQFQKWFDLTGLQRHLKVLGQFARKALNENNNDYLKDLPRVLHYVLDVCSKYPELTALHKLLQESPPK
jgi:aminoglycoside/choline kinase family phosphotransferase